MASSGTVRPYACLTDDTPLAEHLRVYGLYIIGILANEDGAKLPQLSSGRPPAELILIANAGPVFWNRFKSERRNEPEPMDSWTRRILSPIAAEFNMDPLFPFDGPPFLPFQKWGYKAGAFSPTLGIPAIHPVFGTWFGLRGAFLSETPHPYPHPPVGTESPCETCPTRSCLEACMCDALNEGFYDIKTCLTHIMGENNGSCLTLGCRARRACPIGQDYIYEPEQAEFHMRGFLTMIGRI